MGTHELGNQVVWFDIPCLDLDRAVKFYSAVLNCEPHRDEFNGAPFAFLPHTENTVGGCLVVLEDHKPSENGVLVYLNCNGRLDEAEAAAADNGGRVVVPKHQIGPHGFRSIVVDSEGNRVALHSQ